MKTQEIFDLAIREGVKADFRQKKDIAAKLAKEKKKFQKLDSLDKKTADPERLKNPYADSRIHLVSSKNPPVKRILAGIDIEVGEILLAERLAEKGKKIDLIFGHHPLGRAKADLSNVMDMLEDLYHRLGVPIHVAENLMQNRISEVGRAMQRYNHLQPVDAAKLLDISLANAHTPTDNLVWRYLQNLYEKKKPRTLEDVLNIVRNIPEYEEAARNNFGPMLISGDPENKAGKVLVDMTGGTNPHDDMYEALSRAGVSTIVGMHFHESTVQRIKKHHMNLIVAGHYASDSLGMNLFLDKLEKKGIEVIPCSGLIRVKR